MILYDFKTEFDLVVRCYIQVGEINRENNVRCYIHKSRSWSLYKTYSDISSGKIDGTSYISLWVGMITKEVNEA